MSARPLPIGEMFMLAYRLQMSGRMEEAHRTARRLLTVAPRNPDVLNLLSVIERRRGRFDQALVRIDQAIAVNPSAAIYHANRGGTLTDLGRLDGAVEAYREALRLDANLADVHTGLAFALRCASRLDEAETEARSALRRAPGDPSLYSNLGCLLADMGRPQEALACFGDSLRLRIDNPEARYNRAMTLLLCGHLRDGWSEYEARWQTPRLVPRGFRQPLWRGETLAGRTLLVHHEQGFGDTIQFCRYVPLAARSGRVIVEVPAGLVRLMEGLDGVAGVIRRGDALPHFDLHCPVMSLPAAFGTGLENIPASIPYLRAQSADVARWKERVSGLRGLSVGLVWAGNPEIPSVDWKRSIAPGRLGVLGGVAGVTLISLQKGAGGVAGEAAPPMHDWTGELADFADTAALIEALDLVIGVDTSVIHLAGALGKTVWLLNRFETCWRWMLEREDSPWYPSLRLFRQQRAGDWDGVLERVRHELHALAQGRGA